MAEGKKILLERVSLRYGSYTAVNEVSLEVGAGEFLSLLGPSGCGKTTTLRMIAGFAVPSDGRIVVGGVDVTHMPARRRGVGLVFQSYALWPHMTVFENIAFGLNLRRHSRPAIRAKVDEVLTLTNLSGLEARYPRELSGGQQQRVAVARALALDPPVLLMDEPLSNLDRKLRVDMRRELKQLQRRIGMTTLYVTHDQEEALSMSDRVAVMDKGSVLRVARPEDVYDDPGSEFIAAFVGSVNILDGTVVDVADGTCSFRSDEGIALKFAPKIAVAAGAHIRLMVRPERIRIGRTAGGEENALPARVSFVEYFGTGIKYALDLAGGRQLTAQAHNVGTDRLAVGEDAFALIDSRHFSVLR